MENASKALIFAAEVLIGVIIISMGVYLYLSFKSSTVNMEKQMETSQVETFNNQYIAYENKDNLTIYDVITVANMADQNNKKYDLYSEGAKDYNYYIAVDLYMTNSDFNKNIEKNKIDYNTIKSRFTIQTGVKRGELMNFKCKVEINEKTQRVNKVTFTKN